MSPVARDCPGTLRYSRRDPTSTEEVPFFYLSALTSKALRDDALLGDRGGPLEPAVFGRFGDVVEFALRAGTLCIRTAISQMSRPSRSTSHICARSIVNNTSAITKMLDDWNLAPQLAASPRRRRCTAPGSARCAGRDLVEIGVKWKVGSYRAHVTKRIHRLPSLHSSVPQACASSRDPGTDRTPRSLQSQVGKGRPMKRWFTELGSQTRHRMRMAVACGGEWRI